MERTMEQASRVFAAQDGLALVAQLRAAGVSPGVIRQRVATGEWQRLARGLVAVGVPTSWRQRVRAALLAAGPHAVVSHATAARLHRFDGYDRDDRIVLTGATAHQIRSLPGVEVHRSGMLGPSDRHELDGLACTSRPATLIQITAVDGRDAGGRAMDGMLREGNSPEWIRWTATRWRRSGVAGPADVLDLLRQRVDSRLPRSWFQRLAKRAIGRHGLTMVDEFPVRSADGVLLAELDLALPELLIGVECQSWRWHATPTARAADAARRRRLRLMGWEIQEVWWTDLDRIDEVVAELRLLIAARMATFSSQKMSSTTTTATRTPRGGHS
jgi:hypothetical protein